MKEHTSSIRTRLAGIALLTLGVGLDLDLAVPLQAQAPALETPAVTQDGVRLQWRGGEAGTAFTVQSRDVASGAVWLMPNAAFPWPTTALEWLDTRPVEGARFYQLLAVPAAERGKVLSATPVKSYTTAELSFIFALAGIPLTPQHPVAVHKLVYETISPLGARVQASGVVAVPATDGVAWPLVTYQHGTLAKKSEAPSANLLGEQLLGVAFATAGYVAALPDYLGLGDSPGLQPYHHARSQGTAAVDMLRAARTFCATHSIALTSKFFLCGYSQGGYAAMALLREIEQYHADEFPVTDAAAMAGAYDLSGVTADDFLSGREVPNPYYSALLLAAYQEVYRLAPTLAELLAPPYNTTLPPLLDGQHTGTEINAVMPSVPSRVLKSEYLAAFRSDPNHPLRQVLRDNDLIHWRPQSLLRLYHCDQDRDVLFANAEAALASFHAQGASQVELINPAPGADHGGCSEPSLLAAKAWFDSLR